METRAIFLAFAAAIMLSGLASAQVTWNNALSFANVSVSPNPVVAGGTAVIRFQIYNSYDYWVYNTNLQPEGSYPLLNVSPLNSDILGLVNPGATSTYFNYTVSIPSTTPSGVYTLTFVATYYAYGSSGIVVGTSSMPVSFYVQNKPKITVTAASSLPSALYSGYNQTVSLLVQNTGYGTARNVSISLSGKNGLTILSSVDSFFIPNLTRGSSVTEPVLVSADSNGQASLLANITYYSSSLNQRFSNAEDVNLSVAPAAQFSVGSQSSGIAPGSTDVPVWFVITNTGTSDARQMQLELETSYPVTPVASTAYINDLPEGASANVVFLVSADGQGVPGNYPVTLYEQWKQPNGAANQQFSGSDNYFITVYTGSSGAILEYGVVAVVVIAIAAFAYSRRKKQRSKK
jgi:hypothetical protein